LRTTRQFRVFLLLTAILALGSMAWGWVRWRGQAPDRAAWAAVRSDLVARSTRIDSLKQVIARMQASLEADKRVIASAGERLGHLGRQAVNGRLPEAERRRYLQEIERHDAAVASHNAELGALERTWAEYSSSVDDYNVLVDSANALQRRAVQEGIQLESPGP
jgi:hypothetical protein